MTDSNYTDDKSIPDDALLWRRIPRSHLIPDLDKGTVRISSAAFDDSANGSPMSVAIASEASTAEDFLNLEPNSREFALSAITARLVRENNLLIVRDPQTGNPGHALIVGRKTKSIKRNLAKGASWVIEPRQEIIEELLNTT